MNYIKRESNKFICEYTYPNSVIRSEYIRGGYSPELDRDEKGELCLYLQNGKVITYKMYIDYTYVRQFGITVDTAALMFFIPSWEGNLKAYSLRTGKVWWRSNVKKAGKVFHYMNSVICLSNYNTLYKLNIENGKVTAKKKVTNVFDISYSYLLCLSPAGKWEITSKDDLSVIQSFEDKDMTALPLADVFVYKDSLFLLESGCDDLGYIQHRIKKHSLNLDNRVTDDNMAKEISESRVETIRKLYGDII